VARPSPDQLDHRLQAHHTGELSWPADAWFISGDLHGTRPQRLRLIGLLAAGELGMRQLVHRHDSESPGSGQF
jgi:hypothetical protein